jgi:hypothetical protein
MPTQINDIDYEWVCEMVTDDENLMYNIQTAIRNAGRKNMPTPVSECSDIHQEKGVNMDNKAVSGKLLI